MKRVRARGGQGVAEGVQAAEQRMEAGVGQFAVFRLQCAVEPFAGPVDPCGYRRNGDAKKAEARAKLRHGQRLDGREVSSRELTEASIDDVASGQAKGSKGFGAEAAPRPTGQRSSTGRRRSGRRRKSPPPRAAALSPGSSQKSPDGSRGRHGSRIYVAA